MLRKINLAFWSEKLATFAASITDERERVIWQERMVAIDPVSLSELGKRYDVSKERIRRIRASKRKRLREYFEQNMGDEIDFEFFDSGRGPLTATLRDQTYSCGSQRISFIQALDALPSRIDDFGRSERHRPLHGPVASTVSTRS